MKQSPLYGYGEGSHGVEKHHRTGISGEVEGDRDAGKSRDATFQSSEESCTTAA